MANLLDLKPPLTELPKQEQIDLHEKIRLSRKVSKVITVKKRKAVNKRASNINKVVSKMTPEQARAILEQLKKEGKV